MKREDGGGGGGGAGDIIELDQVIEGDSFPSENYRFSKVGESVPIKPPSPSDDDDCLYDSRSPPSFPLAVSERFRLLFIAHSHGFYVARTKEVMALAEDIKLQKEGSSQSIHDLCFLNLSSIGRVSILALSFDDSLLAASVANHLHFFSISALLHKEQKPAFSFCLNDISCIADFKWARKAEKNYVALSNDGKLYQGIGQGSPVNIMANVDAVDWSPNSAFVAVARNNVLSIMSSQFKEKFSFSLSSTSIKVDSIRWVRADSIVLGCFEVGDDSEQPSYFIQVIATQCPEITDMSSKPVALSFSYVFLDYQCDVVPHASGPNMFLSYLDHQKLAFIANRKNLSQHIVLLDWSLADKKNDAAVVEISNDAWVAHILTQDNGDDNLILASCVDKVSQNHEVTFAVGEEEKVYPCCILLCLTIDGKLSLFHFISAAGASGSPEVIANSDGKEDSCSVVLPEHDLSEISSEAQEENMRHFPLLWGHDVSKMAEAHTIANVGRANDNLDASWASRKPAKQSSFDNLVQKPPISSGTLKRDTEETFSVQMPSQDGSKLETLSAEKAGHESEDLLSKTCHLEKVPGTKTREFCDMEAFSAAKRHGNSLSVSTGLSSQSTSKNLQASGSSEFQENYVPTGLRIPSPSFSTEKATPAKIHDENFLMFPTSNIDKKLPRDPDRNMLHSAGDLFQSPNSKETTVPAVRIDSSGQIPMPKGDKGPISAFGKSQVLFQESFTSGLYSVPEVYEENLSASSQWPINEKNLLKQICNVEGMARKMDSLLEAIGGEGGFRDASTTSQEDSVVALEEGLLTVSERCRMWRGVLEERLREIQLLLDKTVQVSAKRICMKGIFQQATDKWYWDLWNCQKLSSELELKRQHIIRIDQDLTNQLVELERHFNTMEFNRFGETGVAQTNPRATQSSHGKSRQQSFYSLQNTVGAQLAAAEKLSECLRKQMIALNVHCPAKRQNVRKELFETLGLTYDGASYDSPGNQKGSATPTQKIQSTSSSVTAHEHSYRSQYTSVKTSEQESARRRRYSLDQKWSSFEAPKATVKRIILQERASSSTSKTPAEVKEKHLKPRSPRYTTAGETILPLPKSLSSQVNLSTTSSLEVKEKHLKPRPPRDTTASETVLPSPEGLTPQVNLSTALSSFSKASTATSSSVIFSGTFSPSETKIETHQKVSDLIVSSSTSAFFPSFTVPKLDGLSSTTPFFRNKDAVALETGPQPSESESGLKRDGDSTEGTRLSNSSSTVGEMFKTAVSVSQLELSNGALNFVVESTTQSTAATNFSAGLKFENQPNIGGMSDSTAEMALNDKLQQPLPSTTTPPAATVSGISNDGKDGISVSDEDEMEEEAPEGSLANELALGNLGGFGIGPTPVSTLVRPNPFGGEMLNKAASSPFTLPTADGELFRPASFNFQSPLSSQPSQPANIGAFSSGFNTGNTSQGATASGFGQPAQFGSGQQALGSVLGAFGQSRVLGSSPPRSGITPPSGLSGMSTGGFGGGFSSIASSGGGFASLATSSSLGGGFAAAALTGGGGGFAAAATAGGGFSGGFGAFSNPPSGGGFSTFANSSGAGRPPSELFTQMRK